MRAPPASATASARPLSPGQPSWASKLLDEIGYDPFGVTDLTTEMTRINALAPDVLLVTGYYNDGLLAARNAEDVALDVDLVFGVAQGTYDVPQFVDRCRRPGPMFLRQQLPLGRLQCGGNGRA